MTCMWLFPGMGEKVTLLTIGVPKPFMANRALVVGLAGMYSLVNLIALRMAKAATTCLARITDNFLGI